MWEGEVVLEPQPVPEHGVEFHIETRYHIRRSGETRIAVKISPKGPSLLLPRMGLAFVLPPEFEQITYYGRGPWENHRDRKSGAFMGCYTDTVSAMLTPYAKPQDCGNRDDVRWWEIRNAQGTGIRLSSETHFSASALFYAAMELVHASHQHTLPARNKTVVSLDARQQGIGGASCGPPPMERDRVHAEPVEFEFTLQLLPQTQKYFFTH